MLEGISFLILLVCSVIKRVADMPSVVFIPGLIHAALFFLLLWVIFQAWGAKLLTTNQSAMVFVASLIPFGPFFIDRKLALTETQSTDAVD